MRMLEQIPLQKLPFENSRYNLQSDESRQILLALDCLSEDQAVGSDQRYRVELCRTSGWNLLWLPEGVSLALKHKQLWWPPSIVSYLFVWSLCAWHYLRNIADFSSYRESVLRWGSFWQHDRGAVQPAERSPDVSSLFLQTSVSSSSHYLPDVLACSKVSIRLTLLMLRCSFSVRILVWALRDVYLPLGEAVGGWLAAQTLKGLFSAVSKPIFTSED